MGTGDVVVLQCADVVVYYEWYLNGLADLMRGGCSCCDGRLEDVCCIYLSVQWEVAGSIKFV